MVSSRQALLLAMIFFLCETFFVLKKNGKSSDIGDKAESNGQSVNLKKLAEYLQLSPGTVSVVLNSTPRADTIPQATKDRILAAAQKLNYRPHYFARSLRANQSFTIGVITAELSNGYCASILNGIEMASSEKGYFYLNTSHLHRPELLLHNSRMLIERQVEGIITIDTPIRFETELPIIAVAGHKDLSGVTNVILNHDSAAEIGIDHLYSLGHRRIALIKGQDFSSDTEIRAAAILQAARKRGADIRADLIVQLEGINPSPEVGYIAAKKLLTRNQPFTAIFAFNDMSAIGAIRALHDSGLRVPEDVSVLGFDDIHFAAFNHPPLTTIRQPLFEMGQLAGQTLLSVLSSKTKLEDMPKTLMVEPELLVRLSTGPPDESIFSAAKIKSV